MARANPSHTFPLKCLNGFGFKQLNPVNTFSVSLHWYEVNFYIATVNLGQEMNGRARARIMPFMAHVIIFLIWPFRSRFGDPRENLEREEQS